jgi:hypothetical protein
MILELILQSFFRKMNILFYFFLLLAITFSINYFVLLQTLEQIGKQSLVGFFLRMLHLTCA